MGAAKNIVLALALMRGTPSLAQIFNTPKLGDRRIGSCIVSYKFPSSERKQCSQEARQLITDTFCRHSGDLVGKSWSVAAPENALIAYRSFVLTIDKTPTGENGRWEPKNSNNVFTQIDCGRRRNLLEVDVRECDYGTFRDVNGNLLCR